MKLELRRLMDSNEYEIFDSEKSITVDMSLTPHWLRCIILEQAEMLKHLSQKICNGC